MIDFEDSIRELEENVLKIDDAIKRHEANMPRSVKKAGSVGELCYTYRYLLTLLVPALAILYLYFVDSSLITVKKNGEKRICLRKVAMYALGLFLATSALIYGLDYFNLLKGELCLH